MSHMHPVYDDEKRFVINTVTKNVIFPEKDRPVLIQHDHNSEHITFECDRFVEGHDLMLCDKVEIHYKNILDSRHSVSGVYPVVDLKISDSNKSKVVFTWSVSLNATTYNGPLWFVITFSCTNEGDINYRWSTNICKDLTVAEGLDNGEAVEQNYADVLENWRLELFGIGDTEEARMLAAAQIMMHDIEQKGKATLDTIPDEYLDYESFADSIDTPSAIRINNHGRYLNPVGEPTSSNDYAITDYIFYAGGDILLRGVWAGASSLVIAYYDADKKFISGINNIDGNLFIGEGDVPSGTEFIRCGTSVTDRPNPVVFVNTYKVAAKHSSDILSLEEKTKEINSELESIRSAVNRTLAFSVGGYVQPTGYYNPTPNAEITDYAKVDGYSKISVKVNISENGAAIAYYDENKNFLSNISVLGNATNGDVEGVYDIPEEAHYVRVSNYGLENECYAVLIGEHSLTGKPYEGKKILTIGDSITAIEAGSSDYSRSWKKYFREIVKPALVVSTAVPGATWRDKNGTVYDGNPVIDGEDDNRNNVIGNQIEKIVRGKDSTHSEYSRVAEYDNFDAIFIAAGTNDYVANTSLKDTADISLLDIEDCFYDGDIAITDLKTLDRTTWAGAMRYSIDTLRALYPNADIFVCTPIQRAGREQYNAVLYKGTMMAKVAKRLGVILVDSMECGVYDMTCPSAGKEGDFNDGLHLSAQGAKKLGEYNARRFIEHYSY